MPRWTFLLVAIGGVAIAALAWLGSWREIDRAVPTLDRRAARAEFAANMLRDPATGRIPAGIRTRELAHAASIPHRTLGKTSVFFDWTEKGPNTLAGRTRALAVDLTDSQTLLAGGASGGVWKSTDAGNSWRLTSDYLGVTSLAQDPREGHTDTWYFSAGELVGSTRSEFSVAPFHGNGVYKSTDGGESWTLLASTASDPTVPLSPFNNTWRVRVSPVTGTVFVAGNGLGVYRSEDGGESFEKALGSDKPRHVDVAVGGTGILLASLSSAQAEGGMDASNAGLFVSGDDGRTWTAVVAPGLPEEHNRTVVAMAPSNTDVAYALSEGPGNKPIVFHRISLSGATAEDRTENLPPFQGGEINTQGGYNMALAVKPDDEGFVLVAGVNLFRSRDGFATPATDEEDVRISANTTGALCVDQHEIVFDPVEPTRVWIGCDQGIYTTFDATPRILTFRSLNRGYNTTQFYAAAMSAEAGDDRVVGGMQDWGSIAFESPNFTFLLGVGDGGYAHVGPRFAYSSLQTGNVLRHRYDRFGNPETHIELSPLRNVLWISPFAIDPTDERIMYYPLANVIQRHPNIEQNIPQHVLWKALDEAALPQEYFITALAVSTDPAHVLYYAGWHPPKPPMLYRLAHADTATRGAVDVSVPGLVEGAYPSSIAVNPENGDEILVAFSNYNIVGLFHSDDGGESYSAVEGNLEGDAIAPGPSIRSVTILPVATGTVYLAGTSTGVYSTDDLQGGATVWQKEGADVIGNAIAAHVSSRPSDGRVLVATHGRGIFIGDRNANPVATEDDGSELPSSIITDVAAYPNPFSDAVRLSFNLAQAAMVEVALFDLLGRRVASGASAQDFAAGRREVILVADDLAGGRYAYRLTVATQTGGRTGIGGVVVMK